MYNMNFNDIKAFLIIFLFSLIIGIFSLCLLGWVIITPYYQYFSYDGKATSTNINLNYYKKRYSPIFQFKDKDKIYYCHSNFSSTVRPKENVIIKYDINNPNECVTSYDTFENWHITLYLLFTIPFIIVGGIGLIKTNKQLKKAKKLNEVGILIKNLDYEL